MAKTSKYVARQADHNGFIHYSAAEHARWRLLMQQQRPNLEHYAAPIYLHALQRLELPEDHIPQCAEVSEQLLDATGWRIVPVPALIDFKTFFDLLAMQRFPAASFIRSQQELDYLQEPDIFHEVLGHAPLLANPEYARFVQAYGEAGCQASREERVWLARLFWFTVEFGLMYCADGIRAFGAGLVSSKTELRYSIQDAHVDRRPFDLLDVLRTPYRIDILQTVYFVLDDLEQLLEPAQQNLLAPVREAIALGLKPPTFEPCAA